MRGGVGGCKVATMQDQEVAAGTKGLDDAVVGMWYLERVLVHSFHKKSWIALKKDANE